VNKVISEFIRSKNIDSIQKLNLLLFLYKNPDAQGTSHCFAKNLHLGDIRLVEEMIKDLADKGVINYVGQHYFLVDNPEIKTTLKNLARSFEQPLSRQVLLNQIQTGAGNGIYRSFPDQ
jgi:hypothetical protein